MNELKRQAYLAAMGVQPLYLRQPLPAARPSPHYQFPSEPAQAEAAETDGAGPAPAPQPGPTKTGDRVAPSEPMPASSRSQPAEPPNQPSAAADAEQRLQFVLRYYPIDARLAVIDELPLQHSAAVVTQTLELLRNILHALGIEREDAKFHSESLQWPLTEDMPLGQSEADAARLALRGFIASRRQQDGFANLLVCAGQVENLLLDQDPQTRDIKPVGENYFLTVSHSLQAMLAYPQLKRDVWQQLQPLRVRLKD